MATSKELPRYYWRDNIYRARKLDRVAYCSDCDCTPDICHELGRPCLTLDPTHLVLKLVR